MPYEFELRPRAHHHHIQQWLECLLFGIAKVFATTIPPWLPRFNEHRCRAESWAC
jgi:hypothetical protein